MIYTGEPTLPPFLQKAPLAYQLANGRRKNIASRFIIDAATVSLEFGAYDKTLPLYVN